MLTYNVCVIGAGPAGMMAAIRAGKITGGVVLLERNASLGRKLGLTGKGRCNITNAAPLDVFLKAFGKNGPFLRNAFSRFFAPELMAFFEELGVTFKTERQDRVFPQADSSQAVLRALQDALHKSGVEVRLSFVVKKVGFEGGVGTVTSADGRRIRARKIIVACGGASFPQTGSTGDGFRFAQDLGIALEPVGPGLVPLETEESWVRDLQGLTLKNIVLRFSIDGKWRATPVGEVLFTHFGVSGPLVLDNSEEIARRFKHGPVAMQIDLKPGLTVTELDRKIQKEFIGRGRSLIKNYAAELVPKRMTDVLLTAAGVGSEKKCHQVTGEERRRLVKALKEFPLRIRAARPLAEAMVTWGGVSLKEIDPKTMESRRVPGIYFCGEVLDLAAFSGGFNLQAAFSTGYAAGEAAASSIKGVPYD